MTASQILRRSFVLAAALAACVSATAGAAEWGTIKGKFVYRGEAKNEPLVINKDVEFCGQHKPVDETITLGEEGALRNVFVFLYVAPRQKVAVHPDYKPGDPKIFTNKGCRFEPHAMTFWTAEKLEVHNDDPNIGHNTNFAMVSNQDINRTVPNDMPLLPNFDKSEPFPMKVVCNIHPWMSAYILVRENPYMAVTGEDGAFEIANVPAGKQKFTFWHEANGYLRDSTVRKEKADRKGQVDITVPAGDTLDLGVIEVTPAILGK